MLCRSFSVGLFAACVASSAAAQLSISTGAEYTTGKYGASESTDQLYVPVTAKLQTDDWVLKATVPYLRVSGPANVVGAGDDRVVVPGSAARRTASGLGDIVASAFYSAVTEASSAFALDIGAKVKLPTADEAERLGTGELDYAVQADFYKSFGTLDWFATLGYRWYGDPPGFELRDVPYWALGAAHRLEGGSTIGVSYDYRPRISDGGAAISEATLFWVKRFSREWKLQLYALAGFSDASPDAGAGALLEYRF